MCFGAGWTPLPRWCKYALFSEAECSVKRSGARARWLTRKGPLRHRPGQDQRLSATGSRVAGALQQRSRKVSTCCVLNSAAASMGNGPLEVFKFAVYLAAPVFAVLVVANPLILDHVVENVCCSFFRLCGLLVCDREAQILQSAQLCSKHLAFMSRVSRLPASTPGHAQLAQRRMSLTKPLLSPDTIYILPGLIAVSGFYSPDLSSAHMSSIQEQGRDPRCHRTR